MISTSMGFEIHWICWIENLRNRTDILSVELMKKCQEDDCALGVYSQAYFEIAWNSLSSKKVDKLHLLNCGIVIFPQTSHCYQSM